MKPVHEMTSKERARHSVYIAPDDYRTLKGIVARLTTKYPPDWLERNGRKLYVYVLGTLTVLSAVLSFRMPGLWAWLLPVLGATVITYVPIYLWGRVPGVPRWAHQAALLDPSDVDLVGAVVAALKPVQRARVSAFLPAKTGDRFMEIMLCADAFKSGHAV